MALSTIVEKVILHVKNTVTSTLSFILLVQHQVILFCFVSVTSSMFFLFVSNWFKKEFSSHLGTVNNFNSALLIYKYIILVHVMPCKLNKPVMKK